MGLRWWKWFKSENGLPQFRWIIIFPMKNDSLGAQQHTLFSAINYVFGAGHLRGSRLLSFFAFYYENNIVCGGVVFFAFYYENNIVCGGVGWGVGVGWGGIITSFALPHMWCNISVRYLAFTSTHTSCYAVGSLALPHIRHATLL